MEVNRTEWVADKASPKYRKERSQNSGEQTPTPRAGPVAGTMDPVRPQIREQPFGDCVSLERSTDPPETPSGDDLGLTPDRSKTPVSTGASVTEAEVIMAPCGNLAALSRRMI